ncbi:MAG TPA: hypothetical protein IAA30_02270 [Candidatus Treponema faecavium]|nr:hypothetical protein [Candidatus Treponema faecavium]
MEEQLHDCVVMLRRLVSDIQGAPYPGTLNGELYTIWYEHVQKTAVECFEFLNHNFPAEKQDMSQVMSCFF